MSTTIHLNKDRQFQPGEGLGFDDVLLLPRKGLLRSRDDADLSTHIGGNIWLSNPLISSPMSSVTNGKLARKLSELGGLGIIHRFQSVEEQIKEWLFASNKDPSLGPRGIPLGSGDTHWAGCAFGLNDGVERVEKLYEAGCRIFCLDLAHAHNIFTEQLMEQIDKEIRHMCTWIGGTVGTPYGVQFLAELGFHAVRVGIGNGSACITREKTGFGVPQVSALLDCSGYLPLIPKTSNGLPVRILSDGGINGPGDIVKALACGANAVIIGRLFASAAESPSPGYYQGDGRFNPKYKEGIKGSVGGIRPLEEITQELLAGIRSGISYGGGKNIKDLQEDSAFVVVNPGVKNESETRL